MDNEGMLIIIVVSACVFLIITCCVVCWKRCNIKKGRVLSYTPDSNIVHGPTITVTTQGQPINPRPQDTVAPPYPPMDPRHPTPYSAGPPGPGFNTPYAQNQYQPGPETPYPPTAYPPPPVNSSYYQANNDPHANPPPYHVAVSTGPVAPTTQEGYTKQAPYNPNY